MENWRKYRNFRRYKNPDGTFTYIITVDGENVTVNKSLFKEYAAASRKMEYMERDLKRDRVFKDATGKAVLDVNGQPVLLPEREVSLDKLIGEDWDFPASASSPEDVVLSREDSEIAELHRCIALLADNEQMLINALFFEGVTERKYAERLGVKQQSVNERKRRILAKIKSFWGQPC